MAAVELVSCCDCSGSDVGDGHAGSSFRADFRGSTRRSETGNGLQFPWKENDADCAGIFTIADIGLYDLGLRRRWVRIRRDAAEHILFHGNSDLGWRHAHDCLDVNRAIRVRIARAGHSPEAKPSLKDFDGNVPRARANRNQRN